MKFRFTLLLFCIVCFGLFALSANSKERNEMISDRVIERTQNLEGFSDKPYKDTVGKITIGYGRNLEDNPLSLDEIIELFNRVEWKSRKDAEDWAEILLKNDLRNYKKYLSKNLAIFDMCDTDEQIVLVDIAINIGVTGLLSFKDMLDAIDNDDKVEAAVELLDSKYAEQVKTRALENAKLLAGSEFQEAIKRLEKRNPNRYNLIKKYLQ